MTSHDRDLGLVLASFGAGVTCFAIALATFDSRSAPPPPPSKPAPVNRFDEVNLRLQAGLNEVVDPKTGITYLVCVHCQLTRVGP